MISVARRTSNSLRGGFTILEVVIVLAIAMLVVGGGMVAMYLSSDQQRLEGSVGEVELLAKRARALATLQQRPYALEFTPNGVGLMPYAEAILDEEEREYLKEEQLYMQENGVDMGEPVVRDYWSAEGDMLILVRRWSTGDWSELRRMGDRHVWRFDPQGICEPFGMRIEAESGSWIAVLFHPLTAAITETESEIR